jgi:hypothetical protein
VGILVDYFLADSDESARRVLPGGLVGAGLAYVDCKGWLNELADLVADISGRDPSELRDSKVVADDGEAAGVERIMPETVAALAALEDVRLGEYAEEELLFEYEVERLTELRDRAREAVRLNHGMFRWTCV